LDALAAPPLAAGAFEPSTQRPVNLKHTAGGLPDLSALFGWGVLAPGVAWVPDVGEPLVMSADAAPACAPVFAPPEVGADEDGFADCLPAGAFWV